MPWDSAIDTCTQAMHFLAHELKNRFVAVRGLAESARLALAEHAKEQLAPQMGHNTDEVFADMQAAIDRGVFLCVNQSVAMQLAHNTYTPNATAVELGPALCAASGRRAEVSVDSDVPPIVRLDVNLALHVLENFVTNAVNYGEKDGHVTLRAAVRADVLRLEVTNRPGAKHAESCARYGSGDAAASIAAAGHGPQRHALSTGTGLRIARRCAAPLA